MPRYSYICKNCENQIEAFHSIDERLSYCEKCNIESLVKLISIPNITKKQDINNLTNRKTGDIVKEKIAEFRQDLKQQKKDLSNKKT
jgi:putative FmdB family regulatory protein